MKPTLDDEGREVLENGMYLAMQLSRSQDFHVQDSAVIIGALCAIISKLSDIGEPLNTKLCILADTLEAMPSQQQDMPQ